MLFLGWVWAGREASVRRRIGHTAVAGLIALATMEVVSLVVRHGLGLDPHDHHGGRILHRRDTHQRRGARGVHRQPRVPGSDLDVLTVRPVFSVLGLLVAVYFGYRLLLRSPQDGVVRCLGLTLLVLALLGPIVWAWYVTWGVIVVAPAAIGRLRGAAPS